MPDIFGADIAGAILDGLGGLVFDQTLIKTSTAEDPTNKTRMIKIETPYSCKGFVDNYRNENIRGQGVKITDHKIVILGASLPPSIIPQPGDRIIAEGRTYSIQEDGVMRDPAGATYECQSR
jgi:hypothetical protein